MREVKRKPGAPKGNRNAAGKKMADPRTQLISFKATLAQVRALADEGAPLGRSAHQQAQHIVTEHIGS